MAFHHKDEMVMRPSYLDKGISVLVRCQENIFILNHPHEAWPCINIIKIVLFCRSVVLQSIYDNQVYMMPHPLLMSKVSQRTCVIINKISSLISVRCDMAFIEPMHHNKPNITHFSKMEFHIYAELKSVYFLENISWTQLSYHNYSLMKLLGNPLCYLPTWIPST